MGHVTLWMQMSLDGFAEGPDQRVHWPVVDEELCATYLDELRTADLFLYGRRTYEIMASFWPEADSDPAISPFYVEFARCWKAMSKIVFSRTLASADWNTRIISAGLVDEMIRLRARPDSHLILFGGARTASLFMKHDLIDDFRLFVHPMLLGGGIPLFPPAADTAGLRLVDVTTYGSAVIHVHYRQMRPDRVASTL